MKFNKNSIPFFDWYARIQQSAVDRLIWPHSISQGMIYRWRALILFAILSVSLILGIIALFATAALFFIEKAWGLAVVDIAVTFLGFFLLFKSGIRFETRAVITTFGFFVVGVAVVMSVGPLSGGPAWLFASAILSGILLGNRAALITILMNGLFLSSVAVVISFGWFGSEFPFFRTPQAMIAAGVNFIILNGITAVSVSTLLEVLNESEKRYRLIAENVADVIWTTDMDLNYTYISPSIYALQGFTAEEGMKQSIFDMVAPDSLEKIMPLFETRLTHIESGDPAAWEPAVFEAELNCKDGATVFTNVHARILKGPDGKPSGILGITRDITERKQTQEMIIQSEKMASLGGLAAGMAHEINNPLAGMIQNAQVVSNRLTKELPANKAAAEKLGLSVSSIRSYMDKRGIPELLSSINEAGQRAAKIVENILSFTKKSRNTKNPQHLDQIIDKAISLAQSDFNLKKKYDFKKVEIVRKYGDAVPAVLCDESKIQQVLFNIIRNASEAMHQADIKKEPSRLIFRLEKRETRVQIEIEDNGPGMEHVEKKRVFEPFYTTKSVDQGTGLGLSI